MHRAMSSQERTRFRPDVTNRQVCLQAQWELRKKSTPASPGRSIQAQEKPEWELCRMLIQGLWGAQGKMQSAAQQTWSLHCKGDREWRGATSSPFPLVGKNAGYAASPAPAGSRWGGLIEPGITCLHTRTGLLPHGTW